MVEYIVDVQGFYDVDQSFIVKEFAIANLNQEDDIKSVVFKPPCAMSTLSSACKHTNNWLTNNHHGLLWNSGDVDYNEHGKIINDSLESAIYVYVKGYEKKKWLSNILKDDKTIIDLIDMDCPAHGKLPTKICQKNHVHHLSYHLNLWTLTCALDNVQKLRAWFQTTWGSVSSLKKSIQLFCHLESLEKMATEDIANLPERYIFLLAPNSINAVWDKLSSSRRKIR